MIFDIIVIVVLLISALHAFWRGFIREVLTIFGAIGGVFASLTYGDKLRPLMDGWLGIDPNGTVEKLFDVIPMTLVSGFLSYGAIFILVFGILSFISHLIAEQVRALGLGAVDRTLGVVFGLARGLLILGIFYLPVHIVTDQETKNQWFKESKTYVYVSATATMLKNMLPENMLAFGEDDDKDKSDAPAGTDATEQSTNPIDALRQAITTKPSEQIPLPAGTQAPTAPENQQGYGEKQRNVLDTLIEKGVEAGLKAQTPKQ